MKQKQSEKFLKAQKRVNDMKKFYRHLRIYIVVNVVLLIIKLNLFDWFRDSIPQDPGFRDWVDWNIIGTPIIWGIGLIVHALYVFKFESKTWQEAKPQFLKRWEKRQLEKFLQEESEKGEI